MKIEKKQYQAKIENKFKFKKKDRFTEIFLIYLYFFKIFKNKKNEIIKFKECLKSKKYIMW